MSDRDRTPWAWSSEETLRAVGVDPAVGLSEQEAAHRLAEDGPNVLRETPQIALWRRALRQFADPLVLLLLVAIAISTVAWIADGAEGVPAEPLVILAIVVLNAAIGTWQEERAVEAVAALGRLAASRASCVRSGKVVTIPSTEVVVGDVLLLTPGDAVAADCRLVEAAALEVAEAALTGESVPISKNEAVVDAVTPLAERTDMVYSGTAVTAGRGRGVVVATGMSTEIGRIAALLERTESERTPLQRQMDWLGKTLGIVVVLLGALVVAMVVVTSDVSTVADALDALLVGVSIAVAAVPEGLPAIVTVLLALGVQRMAADHAIVKRLSSVETLGSATVICTDKTGTLTRNEMAIVAVVTPAGAVELDAIADEPESDTAAAIRREVERAVLAGSIANDATLDSPTAGLSTADLPTAGLVASGDPTEVAFLAAAHALGLQHLVGTFERVGEVPFESSRKLMSTVDRAEDEAIFPVASPGLVLFTKGAPDVLIDRCDRELHDGVARALTVDRRDRYREEVDRLAGDALRTIGVAYRPVTGPVHAFDSSLERDLVLLGVVGMIDPPRAEAFDAVRDARRGGVRVIMMTGDHPRTAACIADQLGIADRERSIRGSDLLAFDDDEMRTAVATTDVFARVEPEHKLRIVDALQREGHVVAMTGDGVNDAPALKHADIGVAMGINGTEVSREAADMILADDNFATILRAVREGREIFDNIRKCLRYLLASNTGEVLVVVVGVALAGPLGLGDHAGALSVPLLATQILWINLVTDGALALALGVDSAVEDVMERSPRGLSEHVVDRRMAGTIGLVGTTIAVVSLIALDLELAGGMLGGDGDVETARTMVFTTLVLAQVVNAFSARSDTVSAASGLFANRALWAAAGVTVGAQILVVHSPGLSDAFDTEPLSGGQWMTCAALAAVVLVVEELRKAVVRRSRPPSSVQAGAGHDRPVVQKRGTVEAL